MKRMLLLSLICFCALGAAGDETTTNSDGVITWTPVAAGPQLTWAFKPGRWGMYDVEARLQKPATGKVHVTIARKSLAGDSDGSSDTVKLGRVYIDKVDKQNVEVQAEPSDPGKPIEIKSLTLTPAPEGKPIVQADDLSITLHARDATVHGINLRYETKPEKNTLGFWSNPSDWVSWDFEVKTPGKYIVFVMYGSNGGKQITTTVAGQTLNWTTKNTGGYHTFTFFEAGQVSFDKPGDQRLEVRPSVATGGGVMDLRQIILLPILK